VGFERNQRLQQERGKTSKGRGEKVQPETADAKLQQVNEQCNVWYENAFNARNAEILLEIMEKAENKWGPIGPLY
jgi:hypothetical protein